jgi:DNA-binding winged helix-turn-helix (wHTH) protein
MSNEQLLASGTRIDMVFDSTTRILANPKSGQQKYLSRNESRLLQRLWEGPQTKEALIQHIWTSVGVIVTDASYYQLVTQLRNSLDQLGLPKQLVRTIPRYGLELLGPSDPDERDGTAPTAGAVTKVEVDTAGQDGEVEPRCDAVEASPSAPADMLPQAASATGVRGLATRAWELSAAALLSIAAALVAFIVRRALADATAKIKEIDRPLTVVDWFTKTGQK